MARKEKEIMTDLILKYKEMRCLWDVTDVGYTIRFKRDECYKNLLEIYKKIDDDANFLLLKKKLGNMRSAYFRERKKVSKSLKEGDPVHRPLLWYYNLFDDFLRKGRHGRSPSHVEKTANDDDEPVYFEVLDTNKVKAQSDSEEDSDSVIMEDQEYTTDSEASSTPNKKMRMSILRNHQTNDTAARPIQQPEMDLNDLQIMSQSMAIQLKGVNSEQLTITNKLISDVIFYAKLGRLTTDSCISLGNQICKDKNMDNCDSSYR